VLVTGTKVVVGFVGSDGSWARGRCFSLSARDAAPIRFFFFLFAGFSLFLRLALFNLRFSYPPDSPGWGALCPSNLRHQRERTSFFRRCCSGPFDSPFFICAPSTFLPDPSIGLIAVCNPTNLLALPPLRLGSKRRSPLSMSSVCLFFF